MKFREYEMKRLMDRCVRVASLFWVLAVVLAGGGVAWGQGPGGEKALRASIAPSIFAEAGAGYAQVPVMIANPGPEAKMVTITAEGGGGRERRIYTRKVLASAGATARVLMPVPRWFAGSSQIRVRVDGNDIAATSLAGGRESGPGVICITAEAKTVMEPVIRFKGWKDLRTGIGYGSSGGSRTMYSVINTPMEAWPTEGEEYFGVPGIVVTQEQWEKAPKGVKAAVMDYVAFGGIFGVVGDVVPGPPMWPTRVEMRDAHMQEVWSTNIQERDRSLPGLTSGSPVGPGGTWSVKVNRLPEQTNRAYGYGYGYFYSLPVVKPEPAPEPVATAPTGGAASGKTGGASSSSTGKRGPAAKPAPDNMPARQAAHWKEFVADVEALPSSDLVPQEYGYGYGYSHGWSGGTQGAWTALVVEHSKGLSRNAMFFSLMFFSVVVIVGLVMLRIRGKKMWILVGMPVFSVLCAGGLVALTVLSEGFGGATSVAAMTHLDQRTQVARTVGLVGMYSPLGLGTSGLRFDPETQILNPAGEDGMGGCLVDMTQDQHVQNGWISPRVVGYLKLAKKAAQKERLLFVKEGSGYSVTNGLGAPITKLAFRDAYGTAYSARDVAPGATVKMQSEDMLKTEKAAQERPGSWIRGYLLSSGLLTGPMTMGFESLAPGEYVCHLSASPFLEDGTRGVSRQKAKAVVFGVVGEESVK